MVPRARAGGHGRLVDRSRYTHRYRPCWLVRGRGTVPAHAGPVRRPRGQPHGTWKTGRTTSIRTEGLGMDAARKSPAGTRKGLARRQRIVAFVVAYHQQHQRPPSVREIGREIGVPSTGLVSFHLARLEADGVISRRTHTARNIMLARVPA